jgi:sec-independent protein translocase protein TatA
MRLGWPEIILVLAIVLIVFGVGKLPQVGAQLGKGIREFRKSMKGELDESDPNVKAAATAVKAPEQTNAK